MFDVRSQTHRMQCIRELTIQFEEARRGNYFHILTSNFDLFDVLLPNDYEIQKYKLIEYYALTFTLYTTPHTACSRLVIMFCLAGIHSTVSVFPKSTSTAVPVP